MKRSIEIASLLLVASCASSSDIAPYGRDSYMVSMDDAWGWHSPSALQVRAAQRANTFCAEQDKVMTVRNTAGQGSPGWTVTSSSLIFSCIDKNDPENVRPNLRKEQ